MKMHKCQCGTKDLPGEIIFRVWNLIIVHVDAKNGNFWEFRWLTKEPHPLGTLEQEKLLFHWTT